MKNIKLLRLAIDYLTQHLKQSISYVLVFAISLILISFTLMLYFFIEVAYNLSDVTLAQGIEKTGRIRIERNDGRNDFLADMAFLDALYALPEISAVGAMYMGSPSTHEGFFGTLYEIQAGHAQDYSYTLSNDLEVLYINPTLWNLCNISLSEGVPPDDLVFPDEEDNYQYFIYLGNEYKGAVELGEKFTTTNPFFSSTCEVAGFIEKGSQWINPDISFQLNLNSYSFDMDYTVVMINAYNVYEALFSTTQDISEAEELIKETADKYGLDVLVGSLKDLHKNSFEEYEIIIGYLAPLIGVVLFSAFAIMTCMQTVAIYNSQKDYGILLSTGFMRADISKIVIYKTVITAILSLAITSIVTSLNVSNWVSGAPSSYISLILWGRILPAVGLVAIAITLITLIIAMIILKRFTIVRLIRG